MESQRVRRPEGPQDWEVQRAVITDLYITKGLELEDLMKIMEDEHFFKATKKQYKTHFTKWDLRKNVRPSEYSAMIRKRRKREEEGKDSAFRLRGALVDNSKIVRYEKKTKTGDEHEIAEAGTPGDLSCFTPSPVASSSNAPSPDLRHCQSPNLLSNLIVSPSEQARLVPSPRLLSPNPPITRRELGYSEFLRAVLGQFPDGHTVTLDIQLKNFENVILERIEQSGSDLLNTLFNRNQLKHSLLTQVICFPIYAHKPEVLDSRIWAPALVDTLLFFKPYDSLTVTSIHLGTRIYTRKPGTLPINEPGSGRKINDSDELPLFKIRRKVSWSITSDLEQKHNPSRRRSGSCETIESAHSFLSDSVVDWKELLYGYNQ